MDKKNTLLLTVIAIATLLVAVVGATFAYFSAQTGTEKRADVNVTTSTTDTTAMKIDGTIDINANQINFANSEGSLTDSVSGYVGFTASSAEGTGPKEYCYKAAIKITSNDFGYSLPKTFNESENYPELLLRVWKKSGDIDDNITNVESSGTEYVQEILLGSTDSKLKYHSQVLASQQGNVCEMDNYNDDDTCSQQDVKGYDITTIKAAGSFSEIGEILIPAVDASKEEYTADDYIHKITATGGKEPKTVYDKWKVRVTFVNYSDTDITGTAPGSADQSKETTGNVGKTFDAELVFSQAECPRPLP